VAVRRHAAAPEPGHRRRPQLRAVVASALVAVLARPPVRFSHVTDGRFKGGHITRQLRPPRRRRACGAARDVLARLHGRGPPPSWNDARAARGAAAAARACCSRCSAGGRDDAVVGTARLGRRALGRRGAARQSAVTAAGRKWPAASRHREGAHALAGAVLPGLVDAHSHAFQRAFAGLAERRDGAHDDFWSWRDRMYRVALRITPRLCRRSRRSSMSSCCAAATRRSASSTTCSTRATAAPTRTAGTLAWALAQAAADAASA
jgi:hypothetical protein